MQDLNQTILDLHVSHTLMLVDLVLALHDAKALEKSTVSDRWKKLAIRPDAEMNDVIRKLISLTAEGLDATGHSK